MGFLGTLWGNFTSWGEEDFFSWFGAVLQGGDTTNTPASATQVQQLQTTVNSLVGGIDQVKGAIGELTETLEQQNETAAITAIAVSCATNLALMTGANGTPLASTSTINGWFSDTANTGSIVNWPLTIHTALMGSSSSASPGVLWLAAQQALNGAQSAPGYGSRAFATRSPIDLSYAGLERYFAYMIGLQAGVTTLLTNAHNARNEADQANSVLAKAQSYIADQCMEFVRCVEMFTVGYCGDDALLDLFRGLNNMDPIRRAEAFVAPYVWATPGAESPASPSTQPINLLTLRVWGAATSGGVSMPTFAPLAVATENPLAYDTESGSAKAVTLQQGSDTIKPTESTHVVFSGTKDWQWSLYRHRYVIPSPEAGSAATVVLPTPNQYFTTLIDPIDLQDDTTLTTVPLPEIHWNIPTAADQIPMVYYANFTSRTALGIVDNYWMTTNDAIDFTGTTCVLEAWVNMNPNPGLILAVILNGTTKELDGTIGSDGNPRTAHGYLGINFDQGVVTAENWIRFDTPVDWASTGKAGQKPPGPITYDLKAAGNASLGDRNWHHIVAIMDNLVEPASLILYVDGKLIGMATNPVANFGNGTDWNGSNAIVLGGANGPGNSIVTSGFSGSISEVRIWTGSVGPLASYNPYPLSTKPNRASTGDTGLTRFWNLDCAKLPDQASEDALSFHGASAGQIPNAFLGMGWTGLTVEDYLPGPGVVTPQTAPALATPSPTTPPPTND